MERREMRVKDNTVVNVCLTVEDGDEIVLEEDRDRQYCQVVMQERC